MGVKRTNITYADFSGGDLNFVIRGVTYGDCEASTECHNCYARSILQRTGTTRLETTYYPDKLRRLRTAKFLPGDIPFRRGPGSRPILFPCDMGDILHHNVPDEFILGALDVMWAREDCDWLILTKRAARLENIVRLWGQFFPSNMWVGITAGTNATLRERLGSLERIHAVVKWVSMEPLLEDLDTPLLERAAKAVNWFAVGGESGSNRRRFDPLWASRAEIVAHTFGARFFYKQGSGARPGTDPLLAGREWREFPR